MRFNSMRGGAARWYFLNQAAIQEITLETSGQSGESETGGVQLNAVPKDGGNAFKFYLNTSYTNGSLQADNLTDERTREQIRAQLAALVAWAQRLAVGAAYLEAPATQPGLGAVAH